MKLPIPNDWNYVDWKCFAIQWPDSVLWRAYLQGAITQFQRGRLWDGETGTITTAQAVGRWIADKNNVLKTCEEECEPDDCPPCEEKIREIIQIITIFLPVPIPIPSGYDWGKFKEWLIKALQNLPGGDCGENECEENEDMPSVTDIYCRDGILYKVLCCQEIAVCNIADITGNQTIDDGEPPLAEDYDCFKAGALTAQFVPMLANMVAIVANNVTELTAIIVDEIRNTYPTANFAYGATAAFVNRVRATYTVVLEALAEPTFGNSVQCGLYESLLNIPDNVGVDGWLLTDEEINGAVRQSYAATDTDYYMREVLRYFWNSVDADYMKVTVNARKGEVYVCQCTDEAPIELVNGWYLSSANMPESKSVLPLQGYPVLCWEKLAEAGVYGIAFHVVSTTSELHANIVNYCPDVDGHLGNTAQAFNSGEWWIWCHGDVFAVIEGLIDYEYFSSSGIVWPSSPTPTTPILAGEKFGLNLRLGYNIGGTATIDQYRFLCNSTPV